MSAVSRGLSRFFLRHGSLVADLRKIPIFGPLLSWGSRKLLPSDTLVWVEIQRGHARGLWVCVNPRTGQAVQHGDGEPAVQNALLEYLRPGVTFYDVGANIGLFSLLASRIVGPFGRVVSFEADPEIAARLRENLARNGFDQARVVQSAVWSEPTTVFFARVDVSVSPDRGLGHVAIQGNSADTIAVDAVALDDFVDSDRQPDFIKCDVEGAETAVFAGAENLLRQKRPILLVEMHSAENHRALTRKFLEFGYNCRDLDENHVLALPH
jgi:FkbM family methyltransferase